MRNLKKRNETFSSQVGNKARDERLTRDDKVSSCQLVSSLNVVGRDSRGSLEKENEKEKEAQ